MLLLNHLTLMNLALSYPILPRLTFPSLPPTPKFPSNMNVEEDDAEEEALRLQKMEEEKQAKLEAEKEKSLSKLIAIEVTLDPWNLLFLKVLP